MTALDDRHIQSELEALLATADAAQRGARRDGEELRPLGRKATRTRAAIIAAGIEVFQEQGYPTSTVGDVHLRAGVSLGTFYQYFRDKSDLIVTIIAEAVLQAAPRIFRSFEPMADRATETVVRSFVSNYAATPALQRVWEEVTHLEAEVADFRHRLSRLLEASLARGIARGQDAGRIDPTLDPTLGARALAAMVDRTCFLTFVVEARGPEAIDEVTATLGRLWANALRLEPIR